ncbi:hypothetical protein J2X20_003263 [Pelomonas saccharophila]|uniref:Uncharacterized protein n=1 Tax=Roseateles saccharophilus TaxID=304 RepID=A0ABU1YQW5_ROSSA|nr:hypothetical protein [Roseateles saccharophilus]MDR7270605.1 hypothetical protein [Roseateles saccharophilus]
MLKFCIKLLLAAYATLVAVFGQLAAFDDIDLGRSTALAVLTSISAISLAAAVLIVVLEWNAPRLARYWRLIFWLSCLDFLVGTIMDWGAMSSSFWPRLFLVMVVAAFLSPAYYFSYFLAYRARRRV